VLRRAWQEDLAGVVEEAVNTIEDASLHISRQVQFALNTTPSPADADVEKRRRIVILGTGWAAHAICKVVDLSSSDVTVISPRNYFVFTPMLAAASVGTVEYRSILEHIRSANPFVNFFQAICDTIDAEKHEILVKPAPDTSGPSFAIQYDVLVVAVGLRPSSLGVPGVDQHCLFLKGVEDARAIRKRVTECFECAELPTTSEDERTRLLTFVVVGGGPTGCEFCGELSDFVKNDLRCFYPKLAPLARIVLLHRGEAILPSFDEELRQVATELLTSQGIDVMTRAGVSEINGEAVKVLRKTDAGTSEVDIPYGLCMWSAGQGAQDLASKLSESIPMQAQLAVEHARGDRSRLFVDDYNRLLGIPDGSILALGDCARTTAEKPLPQTAQVAAQQGAYVARILNRGYVLSQDGPPAMPSDDFSALARSRGRVEAPPFRFLDLGRLAYLGEGTAVAEFGVGTTVSKARGRAAFLLWRSVYLVKQVSFRNRVLVLFDWIKSKVFGRDLTRF